MSDGMSIINTLITDRTQADVDRVKQLAAKGWQNMIDEEKTEWNGELKGTYNASDLNRVESAVKYLSELLAELPNALKAYAEQRGVHWDAFFDVPYDATAYGVTVKTDWVMSDIPTPSDMVRYLANVVLLRNALQYATADLPSGMDNLTHDGANAIEQALKGLDTAIATLRYATERYIDNTAAAWFYSGEIYAGEVTA